MNLLALITLEVVGIAAPAIAKEPWTRRLDLESPVAESDLILAVRVSDLTEKTVIHGGKQARSTQQFVFEPLRTLKGIFARERLLLTSDDLDTESFEPGSGEIERGQIRLLMLGRSDRGYANRNRARGLDLSMPRLKDAQDPLLASVEVLIAVTQERDRSRRVTPLRDGLKNAQGRGTIPLMAALERRAIWAAQTSDLMLEVVKLLRVEAPDVREAAAQVTRAILEADYLGQDAVRRPTADALIPALASAGPDTTVRVSLLDAIGALGQAGRSDGVIAALSLEPAAETFAEQAARLRSLSGVGASARVGTVAGYLARLPLDSPKETEHWAEWSLAKLARGEARAPIAGRLKRKHAAGLGVAAEIVSLGELPVEAAVPALLEAAGLPLDLGERAALATSCARVPDARMVPTLSALLDPRHLGLRWNAIEALLKIDTDEAAFALRPHLTEEGDLGRKLRIAEFLGRHGLRDGYAYAIEHMSEDYLLEQAVAALAAIREPKAVEELKEILKTSRDESWNRAAIRALGRLGVQEMAPRFLELAKDRRSPLAIPALIALGDLGRVEALPIVREALSSRNDEVVAAGARAAGKLLAQAGAEGQAEAEGVREHLAALLSDPDASPPVRSASLEALVALNDRRLDRSLAAAARVARLEGSDLLARIEALIRERKKPLVPQNANG